MEAVVLIAGAYQLTAWLFVLVERIEAPKTANRPRG